MLLAFIVASAAFFAFAAPAMAAPPVFDPFPGPSVETEGPGGYELNLTATDPEDGKLSGSAISCAPFDNGDTVPVGGPHVITCTATDSDLETAGPTPFNLTVTDTERSDLQIEKFADLAKASPGQNINYTFQVTNHGPTNATGVTVRDPLSKHFNYVSGPAGCGVTNGELVCNIGNVANGATVTRTVVLQLHPTHHSGEAPSQHQLDVIKLEQFVSLPGNDLSYPKYSLTCPAGYVATDGSPRTDAVDQGTSDLPGVEHDVERLHFVRSMVNGGNPAQWDFTLQNHTSGQAQGHLFVVCLRTTTSNNDGHQHNLQFAAPVTGTLVIPASGGRFEITRSCPANYVAIAPGYDFRQTSAPFNPDGPHGPVYKSIQSADGTSWTWGFQTAAAARVNVSIRCLFRYTDPAGADNHRETLNFHHVYQRPTVGAFPGFGNSGPWTEARAECPVHYKGITATWSYPRHVKPMGNTPEPINRDFRIFNKSRHAKWARIDLNCLKITTRDDLNGGSIRNTASVYGNQPDWIFGNNIDFYDLEDPPLEEGAGSGGSGDGSGSGGSGSGGSGGGGGTADAGKLSLRLGNTVTHAGKTAMVPVLGGDEASSGNVAVDAGKRRLGANKFSVDAGEDTYVDINLSKKERKILKRRTKVDVTIYSGGTSETKTLRVAK